MPERTEPDPWYMPPTELDETQRRRFREHLSQPRALLQPSKPAFRLRPFKPPFAAPLNVLKSPLMETPKPRKIPVVAWSPFFDRGRFRYWKDVGRGFVSIARTECRAPSFTTMPMQQAEAIGRAFYRKANARKDSPTTKKNSRSAPPPPLMKMSNDRAHEGESLYEPPYDDGDKTVMTHTVWTPFFHYYTGKFLEWLEVGRAVFASDPKAKPFGKTHINRRKVIGYDSGFYLSLPHGEKPHEPPPQEIIEAALFDAEEKGMDCPAFDPILN